MSDIKNYIDYGLLALGTTYSLANIETILGIIILSIQAAWLLTKLVLKIVHAIKNKLPIECLDDDVSIFIDKVADLKDAIVDEESESNDE